MGRGEIIWQPGAMQTGANVHPFAGVLSIAGRGPMAVPRVGLILYTTCKNEQVLEKLAGKRLAVRMASSCPERDHLAASVIGVQGGFC